MTRQPTSLGYRKRKLQSWNGRPRIEALMLVVELGGPTMFARIGIMKAMNRGRVREFNPSRKDPTGDAASWREIDENSLDLRRYKETGRRP